MLCVCFRGVIFYRTIKDTLHKEYGTEVYLYATTANELRKLIKENPADYPSTFLIDGSFAAHCFDKLSIRELKSLFNADADPSDCGKWKISAVEWKNNIEMALIALEAT